MKKSIAFMALILGVVIICMIATSCKKDSDSKANSGGNDTNDVIVTTITPQNITAISAVCGGSVTTAGNDMVLAVGVCWSTDHNPTINDNSICDSIFVETEPFWFDISGLYGGTTYYVKAFAIIESGVEYGEERMFVTEDTSHIMLDIGLKVQINPQTGIVSFEDGDKVYVGNHVKYIGELVFIDGKFEGDIKVFNMSENDYLYFYLLGNRMPDETLTPGISENCSVVIYDQTSSYPLISYGRSNERFKGTGIYTTSLGNQCALVKFIVTTPSEASVCISGLKNKVVVDFSSNHISYIQDGEGVIKLTRGGGVGVEKWAILLPQDAMPAGMENSLYTDDMMFGGIRPEMPMISNNDYLNEGIVLNVTTPIGK